jgi:CheY-like chemotaxis protein
MLMQSAQLESDALPSIVLLVEREATTLAAYCTSFETEGLWVSGCTDPLEAIEAVHELLPDLVVTNAFDDVDFDLIGTLKGDPQMRSLPVILLADRDPQTLGAARLADLCLRKPVSGERLLASSRALIAQAHELRKPSDRTRTRTRADTLVMKSSAVGTRSALPAIRTCPGCRRSLEWIERARLLGIEYDYYRWCVNGCGLYCYELQLERWVKLA